MKTLTTYPLKQSESGELEKSRVPSFVVTLYTDAATGDTKTSASGTSASTFLMGMTRDEFQNLTGEDAENAFYAVVAQRFPSNLVIEMDGLTKEEITSRVDPEYLAEMPQVEISKSLAVEKAVKESPARSFISRVGSFIKDPKRRNAIDKHFTFGGRPNDPKAPGDPDRHRKGPGPHGPHHEPGGEPVLPFQTPHNNRLSAGGLGGKQTLMTLLRTLARKTGDKNIPSWKAMKAMSEQEVRDVADKHFKDVESLLDELPERGQGENLDVADVTDELLSRHAGRGAPKPKPETGPKPESETGPKPEPETGPKPESETGPKPESETGPKPEPDSGLTDADAWAALERDVDGQQLGVIYAADEIGLYQTHAEVSDYIIGSLGWGASDLKRLMKLIREGLDSGKYAAGEDGPVERLMANLSEVLKLVEDFEVDWEEKLSESFNDWQRELMSSVSLATFGAVSPEFIADNLKDALGEDDALEGLKDFVDKVRTSLEFNSVDPATRKDFENKLGYIEDNVMPYLKGSGGREPTGIQREEGTLEWFRNEFKRGMPLKGMPRELQERHEQLTREVEAAYEARRALRAEYAVPTPEQQARAREERSRIKRDTDNPSQLLVDGSRFDENIPSLVLDSRKIGRIKEAILEENLGDLVVDFAKAGTLNLTGMGRGQVEIFGQRLQLMKEALSGDIGKKSNPESLTSYKLSKEETEAAWDRAARAVLQAEDDIDALLVEKSALINRLEAAHLDEDLSDDDFTALKDEIDWRIAQIDYMMLAAEADLKNMLARLSRLSFDKAIYEQWNKARGNDYDQEEVATLIALQNMAEGAHILEAVLTEHGDAGAMRKGLLRDQETVESILKDKLGLSPSKHHESIFTIIGGENEVMVDFLDARAMIGFRGASWDPDGDQTTGYASHFTFMRDIQNLNGWNNLSLEEQNAIRSFSDRLFKFRFMRDTVEQLEDRLNNTNMALGRRGVNTGVSDRTFDPRFREAHGSAGRVIRRGKVGTGPLAPRDLSYVVVSDHISPIVSREKKERFDTSKVTDAITRTARKDRVVDPDDPTTAFLFSPVTDIEDLNDIIKIIHHYSGISAIRVDMDPQTRMLGELGIKVPEWLALDRYSDAGAHVDSDRTHVWIGKGLFDSRLDQVQSTVLHEYGHVLEVAMVMDPEFEEMLRRKDFAKAYDQDTETDYYIGYADTASEHIADGYAVLATGDLAKLNTLLKYFPESMNAIMRAADKHGFPVSEDSRAAIELFNMQHPKAVNWGWSDPRMRIELPVLDEDDREDVEAVFGTLIAIHDRLAGIRNKKHTPPVSVLNADDLGSEEVARIERQYIIRLMEVSKEYKDLSREQEKAYQFLTKATGLSRAEVRELSSDPSLGRDYNEWYHGSQVHQPARRQATEVYDALPNAESVEILTDPDRDSKLSGESHPQLTGLKSFGPVEMAVSWEPKTVKLDEFYTDSTSKLGELEDLLMAAKDVIYGGSPDIDDLIDQLEEMLANVSLYGDPNEAYVSDFKELWSAFDRLSGLLNSDFMRVTGKSIHDAKEGELDEDVEELVNFLKSSEWGKLAWIAGDSAKSTPIFEAIKEGARVHGKLVRPQEKINRSRRTQRSLAEEAIRSGGEQEDGETIYGGHSAGGSLKVKTVRDENGDVVVKYLIKRGDKQQGLSEIAAVEVAKELGIEHLFPAVVGERDFDDPDRGEVDEDALIEVVPGMALEGLRDQEGQRINTNMEFIAAAQTKRYMDMGMSLSEASRRGLVDAQSLAVFDKLLFNQDRAGNGGNILYDEKRGITAIDHGEIFGFGSFERIISRAGGDGNMDPEDVERLARRMVDSYANMPGFEYGEVLEEVIEMLETVADNPAALASILSTYAQYDDFYELQAAGYDLAQGHLSRVGTFDIFEAALKGAAEGLLEKIRKAKGLPEPSDDSDSNDADRGPEPGSVNAEVDNSPESPDVRSSATVKNDYDPYVEGLKKIDEEFPGFVTVNGRDFYEADNVTTYTSPNGQVGYSLIDHGDGRIEIAGAFNYGDERGEALEALKDGVRRGGNYLEAYDGFLPAYYMTKLGATVREIDPWNEEYRDKRWQEDLYGKPGLVILDIEQSMEAWENMDPTEKKNRLEAEKRKWLEMDGLRDVPTKIVDKAFEQFSKLWKRRKKNMSREELADTLMDEPTRYVPDMFI